MKVRSFTRMMCVIMVVVMLYATMVACGTAPTDGAAPPDNSAAAADGTSSADADGGKTIHYWAMWSESDTQAIAIKEAIGRYEADTGNKVQVNWLGRDVRLTLKSAIDAGEPIDIIENSPDWLYPTFGTEYLLRLDDYLDKTYPTTGGKTLGETIIPSYLDFARTYADDGAVYYIPQQPAIAAMFYNKAIFREVGITSPPATWDEFIEACQKIKDAGYEVATTDDAYRMVAFASYLPLLKGQDWCDQLNDDVTGEMWGDPAVLQVAQAMAELVSRGFLSPSTPANIYPAGQQEVAAGVTAIYLGNGTWFPNEVADTAGPDFEWGVCGFPMLPGSESNTNLQFICQGIGISSKGPNPDEAAELIAYFLDPQTQQALADKAAAIPAVDGVNWPDPMADVKTMMNNMTGTHTIWANMSDATVLAALTENVGKLFAGDLTPESFVEAMKQSTKRD